MNLTSLNAFKSSRLRLPSPGLSSIVIDPEVVDPEDVEMLQDLILTAVNGAIKLADDETNKAMAKLQGGLGGFPGLF